MSINWQDVITAIGTTVGGGGVLVGAAAWLTKRIITDRMAREAELFKSRLQTDANAEIEKLRYSLQMASLEHQVRFSKLHERRAGVIESVHGLIVDLHEMAEQFSLNTAFRDSSMEDFNKVSGKVRELFLYVQRNRLFLPESVWIVVEEFVRAVNKEIIKASASSMNSERPLTESEIELRTRAINEIWKAFQKDIPQARQLLETEFRELLAGPLQLAERWQAPSPKES